MKLSLLFTLAFFCFAQAQTFEGTIIDLTTGEPIEMVSVFIKNSGTSTVSNSEGRYRISASPTQTVHFSHMGYRPHNVTADSPEKLKEVYLEPLSFALEEVVVLNRPIKDVLKDLIKNSDANLDKKLMIDTYNREFMKKSGNYISFADGLLQYHIKRKSGASDVYVEQSRAYSPNPEERNNTKHVTFDVRDEITDAYKFIHLKLIGNSFHDFKVTNINSGESSLIRINFSPNTLETIRNLPVYKGYIVYDQKSNLILELDQESVERDKEFSMTIFGVTFGVQKIMRKASFRIENGKYILVYNQLRSHFSVESKKIPRTEYQLMNDLVTLKYTEGVTKKDRSTRFRGKELFDAGTNFTTNYWKTGNILVLTGEEEKIIRQLESETLSP
ncbi:MAG: carboxypeptidase-like regulatory domain-containing protein [Flavobacterium sp.]|nr:carboxypeptidase-like regulatory domain-containing protein [Flavobacterium sp.]